MSLKIFYEKGIVSLLKPSILLRHFIFLGRLFNATGLIIQNAELPWHLTSDLVLFKIVHLYVCFRQMCSWRSLVRN